VKRFKDYEHHEHAEFIKTDGKWYFLNGRIVHSDTKAQKRGKMVPALVEAGKNTKNATMYIMVCLKRFLKKSTLKW
jgi:uncharacterized protein YchJ